MHQVMESLTSLWMQIFVQTNAESHIRPARLSVKAVVQEKWPPNVNPTLAAPLQLRPNPALLNRRLAKAMNSAKYCK